MDAAIQRRVHRAELATCDGACDGSDPRPQSAHRRVRIAGDAVEPSPALHQLPSRIEPQQMVRFEAFHDGLSSSGWLMRILGLVVEAFVLTVLDTRHDLSLSGHIAFSACRRSARAAPAAACAAGV